MTTVEYAGALPANHDNAFARMIGLTFANLNIAEYDNATIMLTNPRGSGTQGVFITSDSNDQAVKITTNTVNPIELLSIHYSGYGTDSHEAIRQIMVTIYNALKIDAAVAAF
jgi:hypothetical protein